MAKTKKRRNLFVFLKDFFGSVIKEAKKVIWPTKKNLFKYSMVTILFMVFICLCFGNVLFPRIKGFCRLFRERY